MNNIDHYVVHTTSTPDAPTTATYGTSAPHRSMGTAMADAVSMVNQGRRVFITARDEDASILFLMPVVDYPEAKNTHVPDFAQHITSTYLFDMDWSS